MSKTYSLIPLVDMDKAAQLRVLDIRNQEHIRKWMFTENVISERDHLAWIARLRDDDKQAHFVIADSDGNPVGAVNLKKIDAIHKTAELGFFKSVDNNKRGLMFKSLYTFIDHAFEDMGLERIYSEVFEGNVRSVAIHKKLLFTEEGFLRSHIVKGGVRIGVHLFGLLRGEWKNRGQVDGDGGGIVIKCGDVFV